MPAAPPAVVPAAIPAGPVLRVPQRVQSAGWYWQTDARLRITHLFGSPVARSALGKPPWEVPGVDLNHPGWVAMFDAMMARQPFENTAWRRRDAAGRLHHCVVSGEPVFGSGGRFFGFRGVGHDLMSEEAPGGDGSLAA